MQQIAQTPRFFIRRFSPQEEEVYLSLFEDENVIVHLPKRTHHEKQQLFREALAEYERNSAFGRWGIFNNGDNALIGLCLLRPFNGNNEQAEMGYVLSRKYWGKGIAAEMAQVMVAYAFTHTRAREIVAVTTLNNVASQRVLLKTGLNRGENLLRDGEELAFFRMQRGYSSQSFRPAAV